MTSFPDPGGLDALLSDPESWARTTRALQRIARSVLGDAGAAEDVVQGAWVEALERRPSSPAGLGWLRALVRSRAIDALRRRRRMATEELPVDGACRAPRDGDVLSSRLEVQRAVLEAVDALDEPYRGVVFLRYFEGLGPRAIARRLGVPVKTVQTRLTRAHARLREPLRRRFQGPDGRWTPAWLGFAGLDSTGPWTLLTTTLLMKKLALAAALVLALLAGWIAVTATREAEAPGASSAPALVAAATLESEAAPPTGIGVVETSRAALPSPVAAPPLAEPPPFDRGALRVHVQRADGTPAPDVHVIATFEREPDTLRRRFRERTDAEGLAAFAELPVGSLRLSCDRTHRRLDEDATVVVRAGETTEATLTLSAGVHVVGRVLDADGRPVVAGIWLTANDSGFTAGGLVASSAASGWFELHDVPPTESVGAVAAGFEPSALVDLERLDTTRDPVEIELVLSPGGAALRGTVRDEDGEPVAGALVVAGKDERYRSERMNGTTEEGWSPRATTSDAAGRYALEGLPTGELVVQARSFDHARWSGSATLEVGDERTLDVSLSRGFRVHGTVWREEGGPVPGALVMAFDRPLRGEFLLNGQIGRSEPLQGPAAVAGGNGTYVLERVPEGVVWLYAVEARQERPALDEAGRYAEARLVRASGTESEWSPVLSDGRVIQGRALYADGVPITSTYVLLKGPSADDARVLYTISGSFRFLNLGPGPYSILVLVSNAPEGAGELTVAGIVPDGPPIDVVAEFPSPTPEPEATARLRVDVREGIGVGPLHAMLLSTGKSVWYPGQAHGDTWHFTVDPGTYRPVVLQDERTVATGEPVEIQAGEDVDLPELVVQAGGTLVLRIERPAGPAPTGLEAHIRFGDSLMGESFPLDGKRELRVEGLAPGPVRVLVLGDNVARLDLTFETRAGEETVVDVRLTSAVAVPYTLSWPTGSGGSLSVRFLDRRTGAVVEDHDIADLTPYQSPIRWKAYLPVGAYTFEVTRDGELRHREAFEVESLDPADAPALRAEP